MPSRKRRTPTPGALRQTNELMREQMRMRMHALRREAAEIERWLAEHEPAIDNSDVEDAAHPSFPEFMDRIKGQGGE